MLLVLLLVLLLLPEFLEMPTLIACFVRVIRYGDGEVSDSLSLPRLSVLRVKFTR